MPFYAPYTMPLHREHMTESTPKAPLPYETPSVRRRRPVAAVATTLAALVCVTLGLFYAVVGCIAIRQLGADTVAVAMTAVGLAFLSAGTILARQAVALIHGLRVPTRATRDAA